MLQAEKKNFLKKTTINLKNYKKKRKISVT